MKRFLIFIFFICTSCTQTQKSQQTFDYSLKKYPFLKGVVNKKPTSFCKVNPRGSAFQLFEKGWMVADFVSNHFYGIALNDEGIQWWKHRSGGIENDPPPCEGLGKKTSDLLRLGFRRWYCHKNSKALRKALGKPLVSESRAWIQFQEFDRDLLIFGTPRSKKGIEKGVYKSLAGFYLVNGHQTQGQGRRFQVSDGNLTGKPYCSAIWYPALKSKKPPKTFAQAISSCSKKQIDRLEKQQTPHCRFGQ